MRQRYSKIYCAARRPLVSLSVVVVAASIVGCAQTNLVARGLGVEWHGNVRTARAYVVNDGDAASGPFLVYFDADENPVSSNYRPQVTREVPGLAAHERIVLDADFAPLGRAENAQLANVRAITLRVDPKEAVSESKEDDNALVSNLPVTPVQVLFAPILRTQGWIVNDVHNPLVQTLRSPVSGHLTGVQFTAFRCGLASGEQLTATLRDGSTVLGTVTLPIAAFANDCATYPPVIPAGVTGPAFISFQAAPIAVAAGHDYQLEFLMPATGMLHIGMAHDAYDDGTLTIFGEPVGSNDLALRVMIAP